jgi:hypothetical protein
VQIQISSCTSYCQGVTQVEQASQTNATIQSVGSAAQQPVALETQPSPSSASQSSTTITQTQLGCLTACFGTTTPDPSSAAFTELVLSQLSSLLPPSDSSSVQPPLATEQNVVDQFSWQVQQGGSATGQTQIAVQTNATVQDAVANLPALLASVSAAQTVNQTQQESWQLQIGCLFYCVDSQQVQQAQQATTTIQIVADASGGSAVTVVQQTIWQLQIGCLAWCWDSTQSQASTQSTTLVASTPISGDGPPPPTVPTTDPGPASPATSDSPEPATVSPTPATSAGPPPAAPPAAPTARAIPVRLVGPARAGLEIVAVWPVRTVATPPVRLAPATGSDRAATPMPRDPAAVPAAAPPATRRGSARRGLARRGLARRRPARRVLAARPSRAPIAPVATEANAGGHDPVNFLWLALAGAMTLAVLLGRRGADHPRR